MRAPDREGEAPAEPRMEGTSSRPARQEPRPPVLPAKRTAFRIYQKASIPFLPALADTVRRYGLPVQYLLDVIAGVEIDLQPAAYAIFR